MQQPMQNLEDSSDPITAMNMALALIAKAFKVNTIPTNNNQRRHCGYRYLGDTLGEEVWIFLPELIFTFPRKLRIPPRALQENEACHLLAVLPTDDHNGIRRITFLQVGYMKRIMDPAQLLRKLKLCPTLLEASEYCQMIFLASLMLRRQECEMTASASLVEKCSNRSSMPWEWVAVFHCPFCAIPCNDANEKDPSFFFKNRNLELLGLEMLVFSLPEDCPNCEVASIAHQFKGQVPVGSN
ncbi:hypothetical protein Tco_1099313 [Tanacetum coccineum]